MAKLLKYFGEDLQPIDFETWLEGKSEELRPIARKWFQQICNCGSDVEPIFHDHYPIGCVKQAPFAYVNVYTSHVNVGFFYGADLPDPTGLLEGTGKSMRHIKLAPDTTENEKDINDMIEHSYRDIKMRLLTEAEFQ